MTSGEYLFNTFIGALYASAWWSFLVFPDNSMSESFVVIRTGFIGLASILMLWFVVEKLVKEGREK